MRAVRVAGVVLAAGASTRLGRPKQSLVLEESTGETLVERAVRVALEAGLSPVIAVLRPGVDFGDRLQPMGAAIVLNDSASEGIASSIRLGIYAAKMQNAVGAVVMTCDQVTMRPEHLQALSANVDTITGSLYAGRVGVPAYFPAAVFEPLMRLQGDAGARDLLRGAAAIRDEGLATDLDTEADLQRIQEHIQEQLRSS